VDHPLGIRIRFGIVVAGKRLMDAEGAAVKARELGCQPLLAIME